jgi:hypothetical protein
MKTTENTEEVSFLPGEKGLGSPETHGNSPRAEEKPGSDWKKGTGKRTCKLAEQEENHEKGPRWSWAGT